MSPDIKHGTTRAYLTYKCRCDLCKAASAAAQRRYVERQMTIDKDPADPRHGTTSFYSNHACRCEPCKAAWAKSVKDLREKRSLKQVPDDAHGKDSTYGNWGCRCDACRTAHNDAARKRWQRKQATA